jgi:ABC-type transport system involved in multi-copper enzyme maturation permease subunit
VLNFYHVARNAFRESLREPIFFLLLCTATVLIGLFPTLSLFVFREQIKLVMDSSMATTMVFGLIAAVLCASHTVSREMRNGTVLLLLSKPVPRKNFILAKIAGITAALTVFVLICNLASLISLRVACDQFRLDFATMYIYYGLLLAACIFGAVRNYMLRRSFASSAIAGMLVLISLFAIILLFIPVNSENSPEYRDVFPAFILIFFSVWTMGVITVTLSTRLDVIANLTVCSVLFFSGLVSDYFFGKAAESSLFSVSSVLYALIPNWQFFWLADALASRRHIPFEYLIWCGIYCLLYICFCSYIAVLLFRDREIAGNLS